MPPTRATRRRRVSKPHIWIPERSIEKHNLDHFERFCFTLQLEDGRGRFRLREHQLAKLEDYFGVRDEETEAWVIPPVFELAMIEPTGEGKSTLLAAMALHHGTYVRANCKAFLLGGLGGHGRNALDRAAGFVERSANLSRIWVAQEYGMGRLKSLIDRGQIVVTSAGRRVGGRGGSAQEGEGPTWVGIEETGRHEDGGAAVATLISKQQKRSIESGGVQVQFVHVSNPGDRLDSPLGNLLKRATDVRAGAVVQERPEHFPKGSRGRRLAERHYYRRCVDPDGDLVVHVLAVPDHILPPQKDAPRDEIARYLAHVKRACPAETTTIRTLRLSFKSMATWMFRRQHAAQWVIGGNAAIERYVWNNGAVDGLLIPRGVSGVKVGLDTASKWATTAITPVWVAPNGRVRHARGRIFRSGRAGARRRLMDVIRVLREMAEVWPDMQLVFDRNAGGGYVAEVLEEHGLTVIDHGQGVEFEHASMLFADLVDHGQFEHDGNEEIADQVCSAVAYSTFHGKRWRGEAPDDRTPIDAFDGLAMATNMAINPPEEEEPMDPDDYRIEQL